MSSKTREYKAVANFFKNSSPVVTKDDMKQMLREIMQEEVRGWLDNRKDQIVQKLVEHYSRYGGGSDLSQTFRGDVAKALAAKLDITVKVKG
jgi:hypothetical protein